MTKNIGKITEHEINKIFEIAGIKRKRLGISYEVIKRNDDRVELVTGYGCKLIITPSGISHSSPSNHEKIFCNNLQRVERYLEKRGYDFKQNIVDY